MIGSFGKLTTNAGEIAANWPLDGRGRRMGEQKFQQTAVAAAVKSAIFEAGNVQGICASRRPDGASRLGWDEKGRASALKQLALLPSLNSAVCAGTAPGPFLIVFNAAAGGAFECALDTFWPRRGWRFG